MIQSRTVLYESKDNINSIIKDVLRHNVRVFPAPGALTQAPRKHASRKALRSKSLGPPPPGPVGM